MMCEPGSQGTTTTCLAHKWQFCTARTSWHQIRALQTRRDIPCTRWIRLMLRIFREYTADTRTIPCDLSTCLVCTAAEVLLHQHKTTRPHTPGRWLLREARRSMPLTLVPM